MEMRALQMWTPRRWRFAALAALASMVLIAVPTAMIPTPVFGRDVGVTWWSWPTLVTSAALGGLLMATYVREPGTSADERVSRGGVVGGFLTFFAVGCPVCNKLALLALGYSGALTWFAPIQPALALGAVVLLALALRARLRGQIACARPAASQPLSTAGRP
ncbi:MAG: hypothetical protein ACK5LS_02685 [Propioniciclava sp.]